MVQEATLDIIIIYAVIAFWYFARVVKFNHKSTELGRSNEEERAYNEAAKNNSRWGIFVLICLIIVTISWITQVLM